MPTKAERILEFVRRHPGSTYREVGEGLYGPGTPQQHVFHNCALLERRGDLEVDRSGPPPYRLRLPGRDPAGAAMPDDVVAQPAIRADPGTSAGEVSEDSLKAALKSWLEAGGWKVSVAWARERGVDIEATRDGRRWLIEVKGPGSLPAMRVNYFLMILGETLQRMTDAGARYSIALPDMPQYRGLWERLPRLARERTQIGALFVDAVGTVREAE